MGWDATGTAAVATPSGGGITHASQWYLDTAFTSASVDPIINWTETDDALRTPLGASITESGGVFTFPTTGRWEVAVNSRVYKNGDSRHLRIGTHATSDFTTGPTWAVQAMAEAFIHRTTGSSTYIGPSSRFIFEITDIAEQKVKFVWFSNQTVTVGSGRDRTYLTFIKLADN